MLRHASCLAAALVVAALSTVIPNATAGTITLTGASLTGDVAALTKVIGTGETTTGADHQTGDLAKRSITFEAHASNDAGGFLDTPSRGDGKASFTAGASALDLAGNVSAIVFIKSSPYTGTCDSKALTELMFDLSESGTYHINYSARANMLAPRTSQFSVELFDAGGGGASRFAATVDQDTSDNFSTGGRDLALSAGSYRLAVTAHGHADPEISQNGEGDAGLVSYTVRFAAAGTPAAVPLPAGGMTGAALLAALLAWFGVNRLRRRAVA